MAKKKFYVVWSGRKTGVFDSWDACKEQITAYPKATYKSFESRQEAEAAFKGKAHQYIGKTAPASKSVAVVGHYLKDSIAVDGAWNTATGDAEYQGVYIATGEKLFHAGPFEDGTNNVVEFLAIVHALAFCKQRNITLPIYSDSRNALKWVREKQVRTTLQRTGRNDQLFDLLDRAVKWLKENTWSNPLLKWETKAWGENPADFGRK